MIRDYDDHVKRFGDSHAPMFTGDHNDLVDHELGSYFVLRIMYFSTNNILCILLHVLHATS